MRRRAFRKGILEMPLLVLTDDPTEQPIGLLVMTKSGSDEVPVLVTRAAINTIEPPAKGKGGLVQRFSVNRSKFLSIATTKLELGRTEQDGTVCVNVTDLDDEDLQTNAPHQS